jgi:prepilin-type N-terminal cleavage/methylation domain-containing protein
MVAPINFKQRGFSLIELVVVTGLVGLLSVGLVNMFLSSVRGSQRARLQAEIKSQGDYALASMERVLRNVTTTPSVCEDESLVALVRTSAKDEGNEGEPQSYEYSLDSNNKTINVTVGDTTSPLFSSPVEVRGVLFECPAAAVGEAGRILISFTLGVTDGSAPDQQFQTTISIRNNY